MAAGGAGDEDGAGDGADAGVGAGAGGAIGITGGGAGACIITVGAGDGGCGKASFFRISSSQSSCFNCNSTISLESTSLKMQKEKIIFPDHDPNIQGFYKEANIKLPHLTRLAT